MLTYNVKRVDDGFRCSAETLAYVLLSLLYLAAISYFNFRMLTNVAQSQSRDIILAIFIASGVSVIISVAAIGRYPSFLLTSLSSVCAALSFAMGIANFLSENTAGIRLSQDLFTYLVTALGTYYTNFGTSLFWNAATLSSALYGVVVNGIILLLFVVLQVLFTAGRNALNKVLYCFYTILHIATVAALGGAVIPWVLRWPWFLVELRILLILQVRSAILVYILLMLLIEPLKFLKSSSYLVFLSFLISAAGAVISYLALSGTFFLFFTVADRATKELDATFYMQVLFSVLLLILVVFSFCRVGATKKNVSYNESHV